jgi:hypothetical protein
VAPPKKKQLLVEGEDDKAVVIHLMRNHGVDWPSIDSQWPVTIHASGSVEKIIATDYIPVKLKESELEILGVMLDADDKFEARWARVRTLAVPFFPCIERDLPADGLVIENDDGKRLGVWIMPDCSSCGMIETFLRHLVPDDAPELWDHAQAAFSRAKELGCPCHDVHVDKAHIHTWLAWQHPPGERLGLALTKRILDPSAPSAAPFVRWFKRLYRLEMPEQEPSPAPADKFSTS